MIPVSACEKAVRRVRLRLMQAPRLGHKYKINKMYKIKKYIEFLFYLVVVLNKTAGKNIF